MFLRRRSERREDWDTDYQDRNSEDLYDGVMRGSMSSLEELQDRMRRFERNSTTQQIENMQTTQESWQGKKIQNP